MASYPKIINLLLIGFGPHSQRIYHPLLELSVNDSDINLCAAVDLDSSKEKVNSYLCDKQLKPEMLYIDDEMNLVDRIHPAVIIELNQLVQKHHINGVIIATEPLTHLCYAKWALESGLSVLMDKPISSYEGVSTSPEAAAQVADDYYQLNRIYQHQKSNYPHLIFSLMAQRRYQTSFNLIKDRIQTCFEETNCPVTNVQTFHSDGQWRMPSEIVDQHYHPYNQGYGKCSHSGYHYFDIIPYILESGLGGDKYYDNVDVFSSAVRPDDVLSQMSLRDYELLFGESLFRQHNKYDEESLRSYFATYGEVDCSSHIAFKKGDRILTSVSVNLTHNGYSQRNWVTAAGRDLYKGNGRISHESHIIQQGPFQSIHFHSYKSDEPFISTSCADERVGTKEHLEIYIFRNHKMLGGKHVEVLNVDDLIRMEGGKKGLIGKSKAKAFYEFIQGMRGEIFPEEMKSDFSKHEAGAVLVSAVYQSICAQYSGRAPQVNRVLNIGQCRQRMYEEIETSVA